MYQSSARERIGRQLGEEDDGFEGDSEEDERAIRVYTGPILCYNSKVNNQNAMSKAQDLELIQAYRSGDQSASMQLLDKYERLCHKLARKFSFTATNHDHEDLVQEGRIGLLHAIETYDDSRGASFMTWAYYHVRGCISSAGRSDRKQPKYPMSIEDSPRAYNVIDPGQDLVVRDDLPSNFIQRLIEECCGGFHTKRAKIVMDRYGLLGRPELRNCECAEKYGMTKYAVNSHTYGFKQKVRARYPELAAYV